MSQAARRALDLLEQVARSDEALTSTELASHTGLDKSTAARLLRLLDERALVSRESTTKRYTIGARLLALSTLALSRFDLPDLVEPALRALRDESGETVSLHLRVGNERICVAGAESTQPIRRALPLGESRPLWLGPSSKVILAFARDEEVQLRIASRAGADVPAVLAQLEAIRADGHMIAVGDRTPNVGAVSVPIRPAREAVGSVTIAGPADRWTPRRMRAILDPLRDAAAGFAGPLGALRP